MKRGLPQLKGLSFTEHERNVAIKSKKALALVIQYGYKCQLACLMCYAGAGDNIDKMLISDDKIKLTFDEIDQLLFQAKQMDINSVFISGEGEPIYDKSNFLSLVELIQKRGMTTVVFTNGLLIDRDYAKKLSTYDISIIGKCHSFNPKINDIIVGAPGKYNYHEIESDVFIPSHLKYLLDVGMNLDGRLSMNCVVNKYNVAEIETIWSWCRKNSIFPFMELIVKTGFAEENEIDISFEEKRKCHENIHKLDEELGYKYKLSYGPYLGERTCDSRLLITIDLFGYSRVCACTYLKLGNIREKNLNELIKQHIDYEKKLGRTHMNDDAICECAKYHDNNQLTKLSVKSL